MAEDVNEQKLRKEIAMCNTRIGEVNKERVDRLITAVLMEALISLYFILYTLMLSHAVILVLIITAIYLLLSSLLGYVSYRLFDAQLKLVQAFLDYRHNLLVYKDAFR